MRFFFSHHGLHSAGCLVTGNTHLFTRAAKCATVSLFKLLTQHHQHHIYTLASWLLQYVLSTAFSTNPSLSLSLPLSLTVCQIAFFFFFFHPSLSVSFLFLLSISFLWCVWVVSRNRWPLTESGPARASSNPSSLRFSQSRILPCCDMACLWARWLFLLCR